MAANAKNVNHLIFPGLYGAWWLCYQKKKSGCMSEALCCHPCWWVCLEMFELLHWRLFIRFWLRHSNLAAKHCLYNRLPFWGRCTAVWTEVALRGGIYTRLLYKGNHLSYIWPVSYADIATLVHNYSWKRECIFSWCVPVSIWENLNQ